jgi:hypothetical protein
MTIHGIKPDAICPLHHRDMTIHDIKPDAICPLHHRDMTIHGIKPDAICPLHHRDMTIHGIKPVLVTGVKTQPKLMMSVLNFDQIGSKQIKFNSSV